MIKETIDLVAIFFGAYVLSNTFFKSKKIFYSIF